MGRSRMKNTNQLFTPNWTHSSKGLERLGPGGLDPADVFDSLPDSMKKCFESQDIGMLQQVIKELPEEEARYHMKRCVDSGLWVPSKDDPSTSTEDGFVKKDAEEEEVYQEVK